MTDASASGKAKERSHSPKDWWDKADVIIKGVGALVVTGVIAWYGTYTQQETSKIAEENRKAQLIVQTMGSRENADSDMRAKMFDTLMTHYFNTEEPEGARFSSKLRILELIALNFQDAFNPKPLFEELNAATSDDSEKKELRKVARIVIKKQTEALVGAGGEACSIKLSKNGESQPIECISPLRVKLMDVDADSVLLSVGTGKSQSDEDPSPTFHVNYFDMPSVDNTRLNELIYAITLPEKTDLKNESATVKAIRFPKHYYGGREQLLFDDLVGDMLDSIQN